MKNTRANYVTFRVNEEEWSKLDELINKYDTTKSILLRTLILKAYEKQTEQTEQTEETSE